MALRSQPGACLPASVLPPSVGAMAGKDPDAVCFVVDGWASVPAAIQVVVNNRALD